MQHISITLKINTRSCSAFFLFHIRELSDEPGIDRDRAMFRWIESFWQHNPVMQHFFSDRSIKAFSEVLPDLFFRKNQRKRKSRVYIDNHNRFPFLI
ncbi:hypothetical protein C1N60_03475 [Pantoea sp. SGAir0184]